jgi:hypothetical protein
MSEREELRNWYSNPSWARKVDKMTDEQVSVVLKRVRAIKEQARNDHDGGSNHRRHG